MSSLSSQATSLRRQDFHDGMRDGTPIALGYLVVSFTLGIVAHEASLQAGQGFIASLFTIASAGEYAGFAAIQNDAPYWEMALLILVTNARYMLMSCVLSQKFAPHAPLYHRLGVGFGVTDEIFAITVRRKGMLSPWYFYGAMFVAIPPWALGTSLGIWAGDVLPPSLSSALSVALYGMFLAVIIPPGRYDRKILYLVLISFALSFLASHAPYIASLSASMRTILLTVGIASVAAFCCPVKEANL